MSAIETILSHAMSEPTFADLLFMDVEKAVAGYDLTVDELASLKAMSRLEFEELSAAVPEERRSFSVNPLHSAKDTHHIMKTRHDTMKNTISNIH